ncbi:serine/threonine-protein kinase edr1 [Phtheirospermum japonicum]|uniref:non-specific serine/threonine protein kinase n=1 Tax=Phtheirospermum japonicum TaxID=374723 RepID=A0A830CJ74_9LAMI|nr:serine/threonine-protein kinase edr1 [Phtheirospermum japonicum]
MSKVKHFLRKLHIGDHHHHGRPPAALDPSPRTASPSPSQPLASSSPSSSDLPQTVLSSDNGSSSSSNFNFFEEEFQMQLALAISVSDPGQNRVDSETAQINVAKQISLGCSPTQNISEFMSLRYWNSVSTMAKKPTKLTSRHCQSVQGFTLVESCNVVNYDEKVIDGFYDVCGIDSNLVVQTKMPSLKELEATSPLDDIGCEVVLVNRAVDVELQKLEERVYYMSKECHALDKALNTSFLVQKIAKLIVDRMGGPVTDVDDMFRRWRARNHELRIYLNTIILPLGSLDIGHSRQRALLFKVLADRINLPCKLVKGSYYTGTDEGAVNLIKLDDGSEYIIDLMGAPGTLIPAEVPSGHHQNLGLDARRISTTAGNGSKMCTTFNEGAKIRSFTPSVNETPESGSSGSKSSAIAMESNMKGMSSNDCREDKILGKNERPLLPITGLQLFNSTFNSSSAHLAERLGAHLFNLEPEGRTLPLSIPGEQNMLVTDTIGVITDDDTAVGREIVEFSGNAETMLISCSNQSNTKIHDAQIDPVLNGVAEILWEDLQIGERIGIGSYGEVYRGEWNGTVEIMLRLRHPNVVLFMGAVTRPPNLSILTEFLPRGSLYKLLHRPNLQIDEKRRIKMALDVAKGMNYLHTSYPIIVHRDLKTPNLLVDKNWVVKVCDFGMSRLQHHTFLSSKSTAGTAEWMAPEVLRNEPSNEKSDVYSFGVILWELATLLVPWKGMNSMQVVGAVGFQGRHLEIPPTVDPLVAEIINECWNRQITAETITNQLPGHGIFLSPAAANASLSPPLPYHEQLSAGQSYYLLPLLLQDHDHADVALDTPYWISVDKPTGNAFFQEAIASAAATSQRRAFPSRPSSIRANLRKLVLPEYANKIWPPNPPNLKNLKRLDGHHLEKTHRGMEGAVILL